MPRLRKAGDALLASERILTVADRDLIDAEEEKREQFEKRNRRLLLFSALCASFMTALLLWHAVDASSGAGNRSSANGTGSWFSHAYHSDDSELAATGSVLPNNAMLAAAAHVAAVQKRVSEVHDPAKWPKPTVLNECAARDLALRKSAIVTMVTQRKYLVGALALGWSLRASKTKYCTVILLSSDLISDVEVLQNLTIAGYNEALPVLGIANPASAMHVLPDSWFKSDIFAKFRVFQLTQYNRVLFLDADVVVQHDIDELLLEEPFTESGTDFGFVPELMYMDRCNNATEFIFSDLGGAKFCHGHTLQPYHGINLALSNTGVMSLQPSEHTFNSLMALLMVEPTYNDTCIAKGGFCQDQRLINIYFNAKPYRRLSLSYNTFCQKFIQEHELQRYAPHIIHYRGGKLPMKPWIEDDTSSFCSWAWQDRCEAFVRNFAAYEQQWSLERLAQRRSAMPSQLDANASLSLFKELNDTVGRIYRAARSYYAADGEQRRAAQFSVMLEFRDPMYNGLRHLESYWHDIVTEAERMASSNTAARVPHKVAMRWSAHDALKYLARMRNTTWLTITRYREWKQLEMKRLYGKQGAPHPEPGPAGEIALPAGRVAPVSAWAWSSRLLTELERLIRAYPMYIIRDCEAHNSLTKFGRINRGLEIAFERIPQLFHGLVLSRNGTAFMHSKFGGYRRKVQTMQAQRMFTVIRRALNWVETMKFD